MIHRPPLPRRCLLLRTHPQLQHHHPPQHQQARRRRPRRPFPRVRRRRLDPCQPLLSPRVHTCLGVVRQLRPRRRHRQRLVRLPAPGLRTATPRGSLRSTRGMRWLGWLLSVRKRRVKTRRPWRGRSRKPRRKRRCHWRRTQTSRPSWQRWSGKVACRHRWASTETDAPPTQTQRGASSACCGNSRRQRYSRQRAFLCLLHGRVEHAGYTPAITRFCSS